MYPLFLTGFWRRFGTHAEPWVWKEQALCGLADTKTRELVATSVHKGS